MAAGDSARTLASPLVCSASRIPRARAKYQVTPLALAQYSPRRSPICARGEDAVRVALPSGCAGGARGPSAAHPVRQNDLFCNLRSEHRRWAWGMAGSTWGARREGQTTAATGLQAPITGVPPHLRCVRDEIRMLQLPGHYRQLWRRVGQLKLGREDFREC